MSNIFFSQQKDEVLSLKSSISHYTILQKRITGQNRKQEKITGDPEKAPVKLMSRQYCCLACARV
ncbi:MAG: hypothetical protein CW716_05545 [Candidatus Bathyarchaeum sp.]|nr:MAG: hypothetical protein CW716_05545 [Candidatus Bathyarchaeum sp.]